MKACVPQSATHLEGGEAVEHVVRRQQGEQEGHPAGPHPGNSTASSGSRGALYVVITLRAAIEDVFGRQVRST